MGVLSGGCFAIAAICFRGAILALPGGTLPSRATLVLVLGLGMQTLMLLAYLIAFNRPALFKSFSVWRVSLGAGFLGALASQFWFLGFALTSAANVRTLALVEVLLAQLVQGRIFAQRGTRQDLIGMALIVIGAGALILPRPKAELPGEIEAPARRHPRLALRRSLTDGCLQINCP